MAWRDSYTLLDAEHSFGKVLGNIRKIIKCSNGNGHQKRVAPGVVITTISIGDDKTLLRDTPIQASLW